MALEGSIRLIGDHIPRNPCHPLPQQRRHHLLTMVPLFKLVLRGVSFINQPDVRKRLKVFPLLPLPQYHKSKRLTLSRTRTCQLGRSGGQIPPLCLLWYRVVRYLPGLLRLPHVLVCLAPLLRPPSRRRHVSLSPHGRGSHGVSHVLHPHFLSFIYISSLFSRFILLLSIYPCSSLLLLYPEVGPYLSPIVSIVCLLEFKTHLFRV